MSGMTRAAVSLHGKNPVQRSSCDTQPPGNRNIVFHILVHRTAADDQGMGAPQHKQDSVKEACFLYIMAGSSPKYERRIAMQPCLDDFYTTFDDYAQMHGYHARQTRESKWTRKTVSGLHIEPLDEASPLYTDGKAFAPEVSQMAVADTAKNLGLALRTEDGYLPIRNTAYKSLLDRAKIGGSALPKLKRPKLAGILNECLSVHKSEALLLVRNEKVAAFHSGDARDYSVLPIDALMTSLCEKLNERFPGNQFTQGYADHSLATASWSFPTQRDELLEAYDKALIARGQKHLASKFTPGVRFSTSDVGVAAASVSALLTGGQYPIRIGDVVSVHHRRQTRVQDFDSSLDMLFAQFSDTIKKLESLLDLTLCYPVNAMTLVCKKLAMPKAAAMEAIEMFRMAVGEAPASAHDVYMAMQEILFILKTGHVPEAKLMLPACLAGALPTLQVRIFLHHVGVKVILPLRQVRPVADDLFGAQAVVLCQRHKGQMQVGRFLVHVYHRRHDIFTAYPVNEEIRTTTSTLGKAAPGPRCGTARNM